MGRCAAKYRFPVTGQCAHHPGNRGLIEAEEEQFIPEGHQGQTGRAEEQCGRQCQGDSGEVARQGKDRE